MPKATVDVNSLYSALNSKREKNKLSWRELAKELDVSPSTFTRMAKGQRPDVDAFATFVEWLDMPPKNFMISQIKQKQVDTLEGISTYLRADRNMSAEDVEAMEDIISAAYKLLKNKSGGE